LKGGPWRVQGGERGQPWACTAPGSHPTATASAQAPALAGHGGCWPHLASRQNQINCTGRGRTRAERAVPRYYRVLRPPSQPLQPRSAPRGPSALGTRAAPLGARECRQRPLGGRGGTWGWIRGQEGNLDRRPPPVTGFGPGNGRCMSPRFGDFGGTSEAKLTYNRGSKPMGSDSLF
jgi:hypothetical protein